MYHNEQSEKGEKCIAFYTVHDYVLRAEKQNGRPPISIWITNPWIARWCYDCVSKQYLHDKVYTDD